MSLVGSLHPEEGGGGTTIIDKVFIGNGKERHARVTFTLPNSTWADAIYLVGDFNGWDHRSHPFQRERGGQWTITVQLELGHAYQFRYLRDGTEWMNDQQADAFVSNTYGSDNFVIITDPDFKPYHDERENLVS